MRDKLNESENIFRNSHITKKRLGIKTRARMSQLENGFYNSHIAILYTERKKTMDF